MLFHQACLRAGYQLKEETWSGEGELFLHGSGVRLIAISGSNDVSITCAGSVHVILKGSVDTAVFDVNGSCMLDARRLQAKRVNIEIGGSAAARVNASEELRVWAFGSSRVTQYGAGKIVSSRTEGSARVLSRDLPE